MKYLVVGLGNIGAEYADTRHNIGFKVLDCLAEQSNIAFTTGRYGATAELRYKGRTLVLLKPSTYMNLSAKPSVTGWKPRRSRRRICWSWWTTSHSLSGRFGCDRKAAPAVITG